MSVKLGENNIEPFFKGEETIKEIRAGDDLVWPTSSGGNSDGWSDYEGFGTAFNLVGSVSPASSSSSEFNVPVTGIKLFTADDADIFGKHIKGKATIRFMVSGSSGSYNVVLRTDQGFMIKTGPNTVNTTIPLVQSQETITLNGTTKIVLKEIDFEILPEYWATGYDLNYGVKFRASRPTSGQTGLSVYAKFTDVQMKGE